MRRLLLLLPLLFSPACSTDDDPSKEVPDISKIRGTYLCILQHDVISVVRGNEEIDTTFQEPDFFTTVSYSDGLVTFQFEENDKYPLPDLTYSVLESRILDPGTIDIYLDLITDNEYRMKTTPNQVVFQVFRIYDNSGSINNSSGVQLSLFLRSQDPDSVYNLHLRGDKY